MPEIQKKDILEYLQCMVNTETPTPLKIVNQMLDLIPNDVWLDDNAKILCPACKDGIFLREAVIRILRAKNAKLGGYEFGIRQNEILNKILRKRIFGIAISYRGYRVTKRTLYTCRDDFADIDNIFFDETLGEYVKDKSGNSVERQSFHFIKNQNKTSNFFASKGVENMKFDVIIGNPPYQTNDGGAGASATPIFQLFVEEAIRLQPNFITMIIPAKWYSGGKGLDKFRLKMLSSKHIREIHDYKSASDCFSGVQIKGGVMYFLWSKNNNDDTLVNEYAGDRIVSSMHRLLLEKDLDVFIRHNKAIPILKKILDAHPEIKIGNSFSKLVSSRKPFGFTTNFKDFQTVQFKDAVKIYANKQTGYIKRNLIKTHSEWVDKWKILTARANNIGTESNDDNLNTIIAPPNTCCTETYLVIGGDIELTEIQAKNIANYLHTKFLRFLVSLRKSTQDAVSKVYSFVPIQDFNEVWDDQKLYRKYGLSIEEINFIESMIKPMD